MSLGSTQDHSRAASGGLGVTMLMVINTQVCKYQLKVRAGTTPLETKRNLEHNRGILVSDESDLEPDRRADLRSGLLPDGSSKLLIKILLSIQDLWTRAVKSSEGK